MTAPEQEYVVQPLGKYGHAYLLSKGLYVFYRVLYAAMYLILTIMFCLAIAPDHVRVSYNLSGDKLVIVGFIVAIVGMTALLKIASRGQIVSGRTKKRGIEMSLFQNFHRIFGLACGTVWVVVTGFILIVEIFLQHTINPTIALAFLASSAATWMIWKKFRGSR